MDNVLTSQKEELHKLIQHKYSYFNVKYISSLDIDNAFEDKLEYVFCSNGDNIIFKYNNYCVKMVIFGLKSSLETAEMNMLNIMARLVVSNKTPHILLPLVYGYSKINLSNLLQDTEDDDNLIDIKRDITDGVINNKKLILVTEWCEKKDLNSYIIQKYQKAIEESKVDNDVNHQDNNDVKEQVLDLGIEFSKEKTLTKKNYLLSPLEWKIILFKIIYTLSVIYDNYPNLDIMI